MITQQQPVSPAVAEQIDRILRGRPPENNRETLNAAINYLNANPSLRRVAEGGSPIGLNKEQAVAYAKEQITLSKLPKALQEKARNAYLPMKVTLTSEKAPAIIFNRALRFAPKVNNVPPVIIPPVQVQTQPYIETRQEGVYRAEDTGKEIPKRKLVYVDPTVEGVQKERPATTEEQKLYYQGERALSLETGTASTKKVSPTIAKLKSGVVGTYETINTGTYQAFTKPGFNVLESKGIDLTSPEFMTRVAKKVPGIFAVLPDKAQKVYGSFLASIFTDIKYNPGSYALSFGGGALAGAVIKGGSIGIKSIRAFKGAPKIRTALKTAGIIGGVTIAGAQTYSTYKQYVSLPTQEEKINFAAITTSRGLVGIAGGIAGAKYVAYRYEPIVIKTPTRKLQTPEFKEVQQYAIIKGKEVRLTKLLITGEDIPPIRKTTTTQYRLDNGLAPIKSIVTAPRKFVIKPFGGTIINNAPYTAQRFTIGRTGKFYKSVKLGEVSGGSRYFKPRLEIGSLSSQERYALQKLVSRQTGRPTTKDINSLAKLFKRDTELFTSDIKYYEYGKVSPKKGTITFRQPGRRTIRSVAVSTEKLLQDTDEFELIKSQTEFKDVTKPFSRATGRTSPLKGIITRYKEPIILEPKTTSKTLELDYSLKKAGYPDVKITKMRKGLLGQINYRKNRVTLSEELNTKELVDTYFHEIGHKKQYVPTLRKEVSPRLSKLMKEAAMELKRTGAGKELELFYKQQGYKKSEVFKEFVSDAYSHYAQKKTKYGVGYLDYNRLPKTASFFEELFKQKRYKVPSSDIIKAQLTGSDIAKTRMVISVQKTVGLSPQPIIKTPFSKTFGVQTLKQQSVAKPEIKLKTFSQVVSAPKPNYRTSSISALTFSKIYTPSREQERIFSPTKELSIFKPMSIEISKGTTKEISKGTTKEISKGITKNISKEVTKNISKEITKNISKEITKLQQKQQLKSVLKLQLKQPTKTPIVPTQRVIIPRKPTKILYPLKEKLFKQPSMFGSYSVSVRRFGKFKTIGTATTLKQAFQIGERKARGTLARTFKVSGAGVQFKTPRGFYSKLSKKEGRIFIQQSKISLSNVGEKREIAQARRLML